MADGASAATINAGLTVESGTASISGTITTEASGTDTAASGLTVQLTDPATGTILQTATTDGSGDYTFSSLVAGNYAVTLQSNENIVSGGAFDTGTYTAAETVTSGQTLTGVDADLTVPEQMSFTLDGTSGTISFSVPWSSVDPTEMGQSIALTDFTMTFGSSTFYQGSTTFSTSPAVNFSYGEMTGLTFAFNPSGAGVPYNSLSMSNSMTLSGYNTTLDSEETATVASENQVGADFSQCYPNPADQKAGNGKATIDQGKASLEMELVDSKGNPYTVTATVTFNEPGASASFAAMQLAAQCNKLAGVSGTWSDKGGITVEGSDGCTINSAVLTLPGHTVNVKTSQAGTATITVK